MLWRRPAKDKRGQEYSSLPPIELKTAGYKEEDIEKPLQRPKHSWLGIILTQVLGALWLGPIGYLLYLNFSSFIIGPSIWCPRRSCRADPLAKDAVGRAQIFDKHDHNTLGALQFAAKALELWFIFIAGLLLYNITMVLASKYGLPIGLLTSPVEFADPRSLIDTIRAANRSRHQRSATTSAGAKFALACFILLVALMCLIVNLMGPAVAVLVLPTLQWANLPKNASFSLETFHLAQIPRNRSDGGHIFPNCYPKNIENEKYSCTADTYAASLDTWVDATVAADSQTVGFNNDTMYSGISPEAGVFFTFNTTNNFTQVSWVPNRQVLRELSADLDLFIYANELAESEQNKYVRSQTEAWNETFSINLTSVHTHSNGFEPYLNSLQTLLKRQGPIAGALGNVYFPTNISVTNLGPQKQVRCFEGYSANQPGLDIYNDDLTYTKCLRLGTEWNPVYNSTNFTVYGEDSSALVNVYFSDKATYLAEGLDATLLNACRTNSSSTDEQLCPWDTIFDDKHLSKDMDLLRFNLTTVELSMPFDYPGQYFVLETITYMYNATYTLDTSPVSNPNYLVQIDGTPDMSKGALEPVAVHPDWLLAAWSVDYDGVVSANRSAATNLIRGLTALFEGISFFNTSDTSNNSFTSTYSSFLETASVTQGTDAPAVSDITTTGFSESQVTDSSSFALSSFPASTSAIDRKRQAADTTTTSLPASATPVATSTTATSTASLLVDPDSYENTDYPDGFYDVSYDSADYKAPEDLENFIFYSFLQALSMVSFDKANLTAPNVPSKDPAHPTLHYWAMVHVWAYGLDSRTSKFGVAVALAGCLCVIASTILGLVVRRRQRSLTELIVAAIEHQHQGELDHANGNGELAAKFRYKIQEDETDGRVRFRPL